MSRTIGLSGTFCAGKDTASNHLVSKHNFLHVSTGDVLRAEATRQGRSLDRPTLIEIGVELRRIYGGLGALVTKAVEQWEEQRDQYSGGLVVSGLRILAEGHEIKNQKGTLVFIDAPIVKRHERQQLRAITEGRTIDTANSLEEFIESENSELYGEGGPDRPNIRGIEQIADVVIWNDISEEDYLTRIDQLATTGT